MRLSDSAIKQIQLLSRGLSELANAAAEGINIKSNHFDHMLDNCQEQIQAIREQKDRDNS